MKITINLDLDHEEDRQMWQRIGHVDALCSILWRFIHNGDESACFACRQKLTEMMEAEGVVIEELWQ